MIKSTKYASNKKTQVLRYKYGRFRGSVGMGIPWGFPRDFAVGMGWVWGLDFMGIEIQSPRQPWSPGNLGEIRGGLACWRTKVPMSLKRVKIEEKLLWSAYSRPYSKRAVQPICAVQNANCAVQN